jgi:hypothetical protein
LPIFAFVTVDNHRRQASGAEWGNLQELRWVLKDGAGMDVPPPAKKTINLEGRLIKRGVRKSDPGSTECPPRTSQRDQSVWQATSGTAFVGKAVVRQLLGILE